MAKVLLLRPVNRTRDWEPFLLQLGYEVTSSSSAVSAKKLLLDIEFSLVIIETPLADGSGREIAITASSIPALDVVLFTNASQVVTLAAALERYGIFVVGKNAGIEEVLTLLRLLRTARHRMEKLEEKNAKLLRRIKEERLLCEAKCLLAQKLNMSEEEAHHYIEHRAMDERVSLMDAALIIKRENTD